MYGANCRDFSPGASQVSFRRVRFSAVIALVAGLHGLLLLPLPLLVQTVAALLLTGFLPGALLVEWLVGRALPRLIGGSVCFTR